MGERIGLSDEEWALIGPLLPAERGRGCRPAGDNRPFFEGMMWIARTGAQWRHLPDEYGKWNSVFRRYRRWTTTGVFDAMLDTLAEVIERDRSADMIDSTVVRAHHCAVGIKRDSANRGAWPIARRVHHQAPRPLRCQRPPARLCADARADARYAGFCTIDAHDRRPDRRPARRQGLRCRCDPRRTGPVSYTHLTLPTICSG